MMVEAYLRGMANAAHYAVISLCVDVVAAKQREAEIISRQIALKQEFDFQRLLATRRMAP
jgi:hypothetical protein